MLIALRVSTFSRATPSPPGGTLNPLQSDDGALTFHVYHTTDRCWLKTCSPCTNSLGSSPKWVGWLGGWGGRFMSALAPGSSDPYLSPFSVCELASRERRAHEALTDLRPAVGVPSSLADFQSAGWHQASCTVVRRPTQGRLEGSSLCVLFEAA